MSKLKVTNAQKPVVVMEQRKLATGYMMTTPANREQRRDLARAKKKEAKK